MNENFDHLKEVRKQVLSNTRKKKTIEYDVETVQKNRKKPYFEQVLDYNKENSKLSISELSKIVDQDILKDYSSSISLFESTDKLREIKKKNDSITFLKSDNKEIVNIKSQLGKRGNTLVNIGNEIISLREQIEGINLKIENQGNLLELMEQDSKVIEEE